jgi:pimeloyl-ACP methyl ester carboxylesterase
MTPFGRLLCLAALAVARPLAAEPVYDPPGQLVPVFDTELHLYCTGAGQPTVLLEAGLGGDYLDWSRVQPLLAARVRVCSYDRAGAGFSARTARPRDAATINDELHALVGAGGVARPFVLVGHSFGGLLSLLYARRYPADVRALVLLDSMHPDQFARFAAAGVVLDQDPHMVIGRTPAAAAGYGQPDEALRHEAIDLALADKARVFVFREMSEFPASSRELRGAGFPRLPSRVLVHGDNEWNAAYPDGSMERVWTALQAEMAVALGAPAPTRVAGSGHQIALDAPRAVADAVLSVAQMRGPAQ